MVTVLTNVLWLITGNNLVFQGDMTTRVVICTMDAGIEHPESRRFERDLRTWPGLCTRHENLVTTVARSARFT